MDPSNSSIFDYLSGKISFEDWIKVRENAEYADNLLTDPNQRNTHESECAANGESANEQSAFEQWEGHDSSREESQSSFNVGSGDPSQSQLLRDVEAIVGDHAVPGTSRNSEYYDNDEDSQNQQPPPINANEDEEEPMAEDEPSQRQGQELPPVVSRFGNFAVPTITLTPQKEGTMAEEYEVLFSAVERLSLILQNHQSDLKRMIGKKSKADRGLDEVGKDSFPKKRKLYKSKIHLNYVQRLQMGQANMLIAGKQFDKAIAICMELVRQLPSSPRPFRALGFIYEEQGNHDKALQYFLIAAFLGCRDVNEWIDLANKCSQAGMPGQELSCYNQACKLPSVSADVMWARACLYLERLEYRKSLDGFSNCIKFLPTEGKAQCVEIAYDFTKLYHKAGAVERAIDVLEMVITSTVDNAEILNLLMELLIEQKDYERALTAICSNSSVRIPVATKTDKKQADVGSTEGVSLTSNDRAILTSDLQGGTEAVDRTKSAGYERQTNVDTDKGISQNGSSTTFLKEQTSREDKGEETRTACDAGHIPDDLPIDLRAKLAVCCIHQNRDFDLQDLLTPLFVQDIEEFGDLYLDIAEAYIEKGQDQNAIPYLEAITGTEKFGQAEVWLKLAKSFHAVATNERAVECYYKVLQLAPQQIGVSLELYNLLRELKRDEEAEKVIAGNVGDDGQKEETRQTKTVAVIEKKEVRHWYKKCTLLHRMGNTALLASTGYNLFRNYLSETDLAYEVHKGAMFEMFRKVLGALAEMGDFDACEELLDKANRYRFYVESPTYRVELEYFATSLAILKEDYQSAFDCVRNVIIRDKDVAFGSVSFWNLYCYIVNRVKDRRHHRYMNRQIVKANTLLPLIIQNAHNSFISGTYRYALGEYVRAYRLQPSEPLLSLLISITFLHYACQKFVSNRHTVILQGVLFAFHYFYLRGQSQEAYYNLGRAFHQVGLFSFAIHFYKRALSFPFHGGNLDNEEDIKTSDLIDVHREAAFNLSRIYRNSGNRQLAVDIIRKYCWV